MSICSFEQKISGTFFFSFALHLCGSNFYKESKLNILSTKSQYQIDKKCYQYTKIVFYSLVPGTDFALLLYWKLDVN